jgi:hypothetical protein
MALTTHEYIRTEAGFQHRFSRDRFTEELKTGATSFHVRSDDSIKIVPNFGTGSTVAGVSDVKVWCGLSGVGGVSRMSVHSVDPESGRVSLATSPDVGCSLTIDYASSPISSDDVEQVRLQAESIVNQRLSLCYDLPINPVPSIIRNYANRVASAILLIRGYGTGSRNTSADGYELWDNLVGVKVVHGKEQPGELELICSPNYQLVDDSGGVLRRNDTGYASGSYQEGGRVRGRLFDITQENFRFKNYQADVNAEQPGSGTPTGNP